MKETKCLLGFVECQYPITCGSLKKCRYKKASNKLTTSSDFLGFWLCPKGGKCNNSICFNQQLCKYLKEDHDNFIKELKKMNMTELICPVNRVICKNSKCQNGICFATGYVNNSFQDINKDNVENEPLTFQGVLKESEQKQSYIKMSSDISDENLKAFRKAWMEQTTSNIIMNDPIPKEVWEMFKMIGEIFEKEPEAGLVLKDIIQHIHGTYSDKYQSEVTDWIDTKALLLSKNGKYASIHSASKYIQRYSTTGFAKSEQLSDLFKAVHYLLFLIQQHKKFKQ